MKGNYCLSRGYVTAKSDGQKTIVTYIRPKHSNDLKRIGREMVIRTGNVTLKLNGKQIQSIKRVLAEAGELA